MRSGKTLACTCRASASAFAGVLTPLTWTEVHERVAAGLRPHDFTQRSVFGRLPRVGDLWAGRSPTGVAGRVVRLLFLRTRSSAWIERRATNPITPKPKHQDTPVFIGEAGDPNRSLRVRNRLAKPETAGSVQRHGSSSAPGWRAAIWASATQPAPDNRRPRVYPERPHFNEPRRRLSRVGPTRLISLIKGQHLDQLSPRLGSRNHRASAEPPVPS